MVHGPIDENALVTLRGNTRPEARHAVDHGVVSDNLQLEHMWLQLKRSPEQQAAIDSLAEQMHTPGNPNYHQWLTPAEFGETFGVARSDIAKISGWLQSHGLKVDRVYQNSMLIDFSGSAGAVRNAFHTEIHNFVDANGGKHIANTSDPKIPAAFAPVVAGVVRLHDFAPKPLMVAGGAAKRDVSSGKWTAAMTSNGPKADLTTACPSSTCTYAQELNIVTPADFDAIYNVTPLLTGSSPVTGKGQTIVMLEDSDMNTADFASFRGALMSSAYKGSLALAHPGCADPGTSADELEAAVDAEWAGAVAPNAAIVSASCASTSVAFGGLIALQNLLNTQGAPAIYSLSFGECESSMGYAESQAYNAAYQQAAAQGASVFVAAGNASGAVCDGEGAPAASSGLSVNGFASTPYNVAVGGTDFSDSFSGTTSTYWSTTNGNLLESAKSYIPEVPWNDSCAGKLNYTYQGYANGENFCNSAAGEKSFLTVSGTGGGASLVYTKPSYQAGFAGIQNDGLRDIPDISLFSAGGIWGHSLAYCMSDVKQGGTECGYVDQQQLLTNIGGGTAFATAAMAGIQALVNEKTGQPQGNANYALYNLAAAAYGASGNSSCNASSGNAVSASCVFHDVTFGDNSVPCLLGTTNCLTQTTEHSYGILSADSTNPAYAAATGWDFASGIGTPNVANLVNAWAALSAGAPTMTVQAAPGSVLQGQAVVVTATVSGKGSYPTGTIKLTGSGAAGTLGSITLPMVPATAPACASACRNSVSFRYTPAKPLPLGSYTVTAQYVSAGEQYAGTTATTQFNVAAGSTTMTLEQIHSGSAPVALSWTGASAPTGNIMLTAVNTQTGAATVAQSNVSACPTVSGEKTKACAIGFTAPAGTYTIAASYAGDANNAGSTSEVQAYTVGGKATSTMLSISPSTITLGNPSPTFTVVVSSDGSATPTGRVMLSGNNGLGEFAYVPASACKVNSGARTLTCSYAYTNMWELWGNNSYLITAAYAGDGIYGGSASAAQKLVISNGNASTTTLTLSSSTGNYAAGATITATLASTGISGKGRPAGTVNISATGLGLPPSFTLPGNCAATNSFTSTCTYTFTLANGVAPGPYSITASYLGDATYNPSQAAVNLFVLPSISFSSVTHNFGTVAIGQSATYGVQVTNNLATSYTLNAGIEGPSNFIMSTGCNAPLGPGKSCEITFTYAPTATGTQSARWAVGSSGPNITFYPSDGGILTGTGIQSQGVTLATAGHNFGAQDIGSVSGIYGTVLTNGSEDPLAVSITVSGSTGDFLTYATNCGATLNANASCELQYQFTPRSTGFKQEVVSINLIDMVTKQAVTITSGGQAASGITLSGTGQ